MFTEVYLFSLFLLQNIDCGYSLEPLTIYVLSKIEKYFFFLLKIFNFHNFKNLFSLHGHDFVITGAFQDGCHMPKCGKDTKELECSQGLTILPSKS